MKLFFITILLLLVGATQPALAATIYTDEEIRLDRPLADDVYVFGGTIEIDSHITGDLIVAGGNVRITGMVDGNVMAAGGQVMISGPVTGSIRAAGGQVTIAGSVGRDVLAGAGLLLLEEGSLIAGDLLAGAGLLEADGQIDDDVLAGLGSADFDGKGGGNIRLTVDSLTFGDGAKVGGDIIYRSDKKAKIATAAQLAGSLERLAPIEVPSPPPWLRALGWLWSVLGMILTVLVANWLFPATLRSTSSVLQKRPGATLGLGAAFLLLTPLASLLLVVFSLGLASPLALIIVTFYVVALYLGQVYAAAAIGSALLFRSNERDWSIGAGILGIISFGLLRLIPFLGVIVTLLLLALGLGMIVLAGWESWRPPAADSPTD
jgi:hypothetical protein